MDYLKGCYHYSVEGSGKLGIRLGVGKGSAE
jgi:hypothetical protein